MGIISINEKRTSALPTHTTGREVSYFTSDKFPTILATPMITGHYHHYGSGNGGFGVFWEDTSGNLTDLTFSSTEGATWSATERNATVQTSNGASWIDFEVDLTDKPSGRPVFYVRRGSGSNLYQIDWALDDIEIKFKNDSTVSFDPSLYATRSNEEWYRSGYTSNTTGYNDAKDDYDNTGLAALNNSSTNDQFKWNYRYEGTPSGSTGPDNAADNSNSTYYLYWEGSGSGDHKASYLTLKDYRDIYSGEAI
tara:strand:- start:85 stop:840 length:756 start_codon:yes stop_codon:yes gene_type:complete